MWFATESGATVFTKPLTRMGAEAVVGATDGHAFRIHHTDGSRTVALPFCDGEIDLSFLKSGANTFVQTGDVVGGKWRAMSRARGPKIKASNATAFDIRLVGPKERLSELGEWVVRELEVR